MRNVWCNFCGRVYTFFVPASSHEHAHNHGENIQWTSEYGYYIGKPQSAASDPEPEPEPEPDLSITTDEIIDLAEQSSADWKSNWRKVIDGFVK